MSGEIDVMEPVPVQDIARINASPNAQVVVGPELRTIFLGMDQKRDELLYSSVKGKNPFKDKRVRQAFYQAIDITGIQRTVMRGASRPTGLMVGPGINGWTEAQDKRLPQDVEGAKKLLADAGYPNGFEVTMNCPNDRYVNDGQICQSVAANLARIGVKINLVAETKGTYFPKILRRDTSFYLLGWTPTTYDSHNALDALMRCPDDKTGDGQFNLGSYCNPKLDELIGKIKSSTDKNERMAMIQEAFKIHADDIGHLPLHQQSLAWGVSKKVALTQRADNFMPFKWMSIQRPPSLDAGRHVTPRACDAGPLFRSPDEKDTGPLARQRRRPQLPHLAGGNARRGDRLRLRLLFGLRRVGVAAQPLRPCRAGTRRCAPAARLGGRGHDQVPAGYRRPGPRYPFGVDLRGSHLARRWPGLGGAVRRGRRAAGTAGRLLGGWLDAS